LSAEYFCLLERNYLTGMLTSLSWLLPPSFAESHLSVYCFLFHPDRVQRQGNFDIILQRDFYPSFPPPSYSLLTPKSGWPRWRSSFYEAATNWSTSALIEMLQKKSVSSSSYSTSEKQRQVKIWKIREASVLLWYYTSLLITYCFSLCMLVSSWI